MQREVKFREEKDTLTATLPGDIDHHAARRIREKIDSRIFGLAPKLLTLDFSEVGFMDSSGIGLIIGRAELMASVGGAVRIINPSTTIMRLIMLSGVERIKNLELIPGTYHARCI